MINDNDLFNERMSICKECPLYLQTPMGSKCNPRLYISVKDKTTLSDRPRLGFRNGCNCLLDRKLHLPNAKCVVGKW